MSDPLTVTLETASEKSGLSKKVLTELIRKGKVRATKPGKNVLVYWASLKEHLSKHTVRSA